MAQLAGESTTRRTIGLGRHAWLVWAGISMLFALFGLDDFRQGAATYGGGERVLFEGISGTTWDALQASQPAVANMVDTLVRMSGIDLAILGLLSLAIALTGVRRGERWAWRAMWALPLWLITQIVVLTLANKVPGAGVPVPVMSGTFLLVVTLPTLLLTYRAYNR
ncbi:MAG: hypothetical protein IT305_06300 [Chloroflexi bacterium]|nr:hypothetical protein [Chloroflexota bacterium]